MQQVVFVWVSGGMWIGVAETREALGLRISMLLKTSLILVSMSRTGAGVNGSVGGAAQNFLTSRCGVSGGPLWDLGVMEAPS